MTAPEAPVATTLDEECMAVVRDHVNRVNPFDVFALDHDPIAVWSYVLLEMPGITRAQRHFLLRTIIAVRISQGGKYDAKRAEALLADVLAGRFDHPGTLTS